MALGNKGQGTEIKAVLKDIVPPPVGAGGYAPHGVGGGQPHGALWKPWSTRAITMRMGRYLQGTYGAAGGHG